jgi:hypothetical protein
MATTYLMRSWGRLENIYGNMSWGFSLGLFSATLNVVDAITEAWMNPSSTPYPHDITDTGPYPVDGFLVTSYSGSDLTISGIIPSFLQSAGELAQIGQQLQPYVAACHLGNCAVPDALQNAFESAVDSLTAIHNQLISIHNQLISIVLAGSSANTGPY